MKSYQQFFAELKRRHVFKVAAIYGAVAFGVLQVAEPLGTALGLSDSFLSLVVGLLLLGFPVALVLAWAFEVTPEGVQKAEPAAPGEIEGIIAEPASKRWSAGLLAVAGAALLFGGWWMGTRTAEERASTAVDSSTPADVRLAFTDLANDARPSIAVLPFADMSAEADQAYFSDGITEEILNVLAKIRELRVSARTSAFAMKEANLTAEQLGDTLGVRYLVEGSVRKSGDDLRITAQLIDTEDGSHLWSEQYDRELTAANLFAIQTEIAEEIADELRVPLGLEGDERLVSPTEDLEAYDLYLAGRARLRVRAIFEAVDLFEAAIARDSTWAPPWAGLAESRALVPYYTADVASDAPFWASSLESAEQAAVRALELDPYNGSAFVALGNVQRDRARWSEAEDAYQRALSLDSDNAEAHQKYAEYLYNAGRLSEAYVSAKRAVALDRAPIRLFEAAWAAMLNERFGESHDLVSEGLGKDRDNPLSLLLTLQALLPLYEGDLIGFRASLLPFIERGEEGLALAERLRQTWPVERPPPPEAIEMLAAVGRGAQPAVALMWLATGQHDRALEALERYADPEGLPLHGNLFLPGFDPIRDDPRFQAILASRGLEGREPQRLAPDIGP